MLQWGRPVKSEEPLRPSIGIWGVRGKAEDIKRLLQEVLRTLIRLEGEKEDRNRSNKKLQNGELVNWVKKENVKWSDSKRIS